ncbi:MAG TPA: 2,5-didehydrogluconate reductase DkgB [Cellvibrionaceae bacterium]
MTTSAIIPAIGFGTFRLQGQTVIDAVHSALALGYRHIDTAKLYDNEEAVGEAIRSSGVPRDEIFLTTKIWHDSLRHDQLLASLAASNQRLGVEQVDLALIHWPSPGGEVPVAETIGALAEARERGLTRYMGISNYTIAQVDEALAVPGGEHIITNQVEVQPYLANRKLVAHCQARGLEVTGFMSLAVGKVMKDPVINAIAQVHNANPAQIALAWSLAQGVGVIPSSTNPAHQKSNLAALNIRLSAEDIARIDALDCGERIASPGFAPEWDND